jgi:hypothetical protein
MSLLPKHHDEFRSKEYWDDFFDKRGDKAFEWYGDSDKLMPYLVKYLPPHNTHTAPGHANDRLLVIGKIDAIRR